MKNALDPLVGRDHELERVQQVLCRRTKNNAVLIGEPGVGKTAIVEGLAQKIVYGDVPHFLADKRILALDISLDRRRHEVPRSVRRAPQGDHEGADRQPEHHRVHRRAAHAGGRRVGRRVARRGQYPQAGAQPRRDPLHRRDHAGRIPQVHREGPLARTPVPGREGRSARRKRGDLDHPGRQGPVRVVPPCGVHPRGHRGGRVPVQPVHHRPVPARQGHRPD